MGVTVPFSSEDLNLQKRYRGVGGKKKPPAKNLQGEIEPEMGML